MDEPYDSKTEKHSNHHKKTLDILVGCLLSVLIFSPTYFRGQIVSFISPNSVGQSIGFDSFFSTLSSLLIIAGSVTIIIFSSVKKRKLLLVGYLLMTAIIIIVYISSLGAHFWEGGLGW